ncbi:MAG TPA: M23 family metallopeptidase, partial [Dehalococcoidia bacterium]|nr:M23 family metallopeptidase [Dehalococcoidia bacterium]
DGLEYYYAHLAQAPDVESGSRVQEGQQIGYVGSTGNAENTGAHLHIGIGQSIVSGTGAAGGTGSNYDAVSALQQAVTGTTSTPQASGLATTTGGAIMPDTVPQPQDDPDRIVSSYTEVIDNITYIVETHADGRITQRHWEGAPGIGATTIGGIPVGGEQVPPAGTGRWVDDGVTQTDATIAAAWEKKQKALTRETAVSAPPSQRYIVSRDAQGNEHIVENPNYAPPGEATQWRYVERPDGLWRENAATGQREFVQAIAPSDQGKWNYVERGTQLWRENPTTGAREYVSDIPQEAERPGVAERRRLENQKLQQDLIPPIQKILQDREVALNYIQGELAAGRMNSQQANAYMAQIDAQAQASLKGTTIFQQQEADRLMQRQQQQVGASMLNQRVQSGGSIMNGILQALQGVMMPKGQTSLGFSPLQMVQEQLSAYGGGPEAYAFAKGLLMGAGVGGQGGAPGGALAVAGQPPAAAPQQDQASIIQDINSNPQKWGWQPDPTQQAGQAQSPIVGPGVGWGAGNPPQLQSPVGRPPVPRAI